MTHAQRRRRLATRRGILGNAGPPDEGTDTRPRLSRTEAAVDVPREDDPSTTSSTHTPAVARAGEEPSDGATPAPIDGAT